MALLVDVDVVQEEQKRQFHLQHVSFDAHGPNLLTEIKIKVPEAFRASERAKDTTRTLERFWDRERRFTELSINTQEP